jgi:hypothetical protein
VSDEHLGMLNGCVASMPVGAVAVGEFVVLAAASIDSKISLIPDAGDNKSFLLNESDENND